MEVSPPPAIVQNQTNPVVFSASGAPQDIEQQQDDQNRLVNKLVNKQ